MKIQYFFIFPFLKILRELLLSSPVPHGAAPVTSSWLSRQLIHFTLFTMCNNGCSYLRCTFANCLIFILWFTWPIDCHNLVMIGFKKDPNGLHIGCKFASSLVLKLESRNSYLMNTHSSSAFNRPKLRAQDSCSK